MSNNKYQNIAKETLDYLANKLDSLDEAGELELEYQNSIITIELDSGKQFIINSHAPSGQIWLSSPISGGLHFSYDETQGKWLLADGRELVEILSSELKQLENIEI